MDAGFEVVKVVAKREEIEGESWQAMLRWEGPSSLHPIRARFGRS